MIWAPTGDNGCHVGDHCPWWEIDFVKDKEVDRNIKARYRFNDPSYRR